MQPSRQTKQEYLVFEKAREDIARTIAKWMPSLHTFDVGDLTLGALRHAVYYGGAEKYNDLAWELLDEAFICARTLVPDSSPAAVRYSHWRESTAKRAKDALEVLKRPHWLKAAVQAQALGELHAQTWDVPAVAALIPHLGDVDRENIIFARAKYSLDMLCCYRADGGQRWDMDDEGLVDLTWRALQRWVNTKAGNRGPSKWKLMNELFGRFGIGSPSPETFETSWHPGKKASKEVKREVAAIRAEIGEPHTASPADIDKAVAIVLTELAKRPRRPESYRTTWLLRRR